MAQAENAGRGIVSLPVLFYPDGTKLIGHNGNDSLNDTNNNGLYEVLPEDGIVIDGQTYTVPQLPGYPAGTPYEFDPTGPNIIGGVPQVIVELDGTPTDDASYLAGANGLLGDDDDIEFFPADPAIDINALSYIVVTDTGANFGHRDGSALEGGAVPTGSLVFGPDIVLRTDTGNELPADNIDYFSGRIHLVPGNSIDFDNDGLDPWTVPVPGYFDPVTRLFYPDDDPDNPHVVPPPPEVGIDNDPVIESIQFSDPYIVLEWPNFPSSGDHLSEIWAKVKLSDLVWEPLRHGERGVIIDETAAIIPQNLQSVHGGSPGPYLYFRRVVP